MLVAVCSEKGSPGATTSALVLAAAWPQPAVLVEADPAGSDLTFRLRTEKGDPLSASPTVLSLATAARSGEHDPLARAVHRINDQLQVVPGFLLAEQAASVPDWSVLARALRATDRPVIVDLGRLTNASPVVAVAAAADLLVVAARPDPESYVRTRDRLTLLAPALAHLRGRPPVLRPVVVSRTRHGARNGHDLAMMVSPTTAGPFVERVGHLAYDPAGVARLLAGENPASWVGRTPLMRSARRLVSELTGDLTGDLTGPADDLTGTSPSPAPVTVPAPRGVDARTFPGSVDELRAAARAATSGGDSRD